MHFTAAQVSSLVNGSIEGDENITITSFEKIEEAKAGQLTFFANPKYEQQFYSTGASVIIIPKDYLLKQPVTATLIRVPDAYQAFVLLLKKYQQMQADQLTGIQQPSFISPSAIVDKNVFIGAFTYLGADVMIGKNTRIHPNCYIGDGVQVGENCIFYAGVKIYAASSIGNNVIIHAGAVLGSDGFGFTPQADGTNMKVPQVGNVVIEDDVEIGANSTIDRATIGSTIIRKGAKLDNLVQIAHNVQVGQNTVMAAQSGIAGSTSLGSNIVVGGQAGITDHITIADGVKIGGQAGVQKSVKTPNQAITDSPAFDYKEAVKSRAVYRNLAELENRVRQLEAANKKHSGSDPE
jgi:UDP-3-O-[3-hydroxymyristoyl] glucosamine N-acyltransferase